MKLMRNRNYWRGVVVSLYLCLAILSASVAANGGTDDSGTPGTLFQGWQAVGPSGGDVRSIAVDPKDKTHLFISTLEGQIYSSNDAGKSWQLLADFNRPQLILDDLLVDSRGATTIYATGHRHKDPGGFFKSSDGGVSWKESKQLKSEAIHAMVQSTKNPDMLVVGAVSGVWVSMDAGENWKKLESATAPINVNSLAIDPNDTNIMYAGTWWRAYKTTDGGKNWRLVKDGMIDDSDVFAITVDPRDPDHIIASACSGIYDSRNKAEKWTKVNGIPSTSRRTRDILQHPSVAGTVYAATTQGFWMSSDSGKTWSLTTSRQLEINSIAVHPDEPNRVFIGTNNYGVMVSSDGGKNFAPSNGNFSSRLTYSITPDLEQSNRLYATTINTATGGGSFFVSNDGGRNWLPSMKNLDSSLIIPYSLLQDKANTNRIYLATNVGLFQSLDRGVSWSKMAPPPAKRPAKKGKATAARAKSKAAPKKGSAAKTTAAAETKTENPNFVQALTDKVNVLIRTEDGKNGLLAGTSRGLYRSYDPAKGWEKLPFSTVGAPDQQVFTVAVSSHSPETIWVGTATAGVLVSRDNGASWQPVADVPSVVPISAIVIDAQRPQNIYVGTTQTLYLSRDGGQKWQRRGGNLPLGNYNSILINPRNPDEVFVGSALAANGGIYRSADAGGNWKRIDGGGDKLNTLRVWTMTFDPNDPNRIFAGTHSSGVFRIERNPISAANETTLTRPRVTATGN